ncbi:hypothetical protein GCM10012284_19300 [Mangrovihabitans endophyticus]|uniref:Pirin family protein n=1 Tax=Mangrovihabitans endophyticus TaxID=1751298 RepID=A0A8J3FNY4_9ACTN|nr:hypothetical protein GCM10012284_19300 [Mangrovihabitans endophyticus]
MPAITVDDVLVLPRLPRLDPATTTVRPVHRLIRGCAADRVGPVHPPIDGIMDHQDSQGGGGTITDGDTQWMTAGEGILHIETPPEHLVASGGLFHGLQLWVNLPRAAKMIAPKYQDIRGRAAALLTTPDGGGLIRVIAGEVGGRSGPGSTHTPINLAHVSLQPGARLDLPWPRDHNALVYVLAGRGTVGPRQQPVHVGQLVVHGSGDAIRVEADASQDANVPAMELFVMGGQPIREPVAHYGPFVMNTRAELVQAFEDYQKGRLGVIPAGRIPHTG